jgi:mRNA-degrading endonuclease RelE of RelBE toxin-antitoxin system
MTRYTVVWLERSQNQLAQIWVDGPDQKAITDAADKIDSELAYDPDTKGTKETEGLRRPRVPPLTVLFEVRTEDRIVEVGSVKRIRKSFNGQI